MQAWEEHTQAQVVRRAVPGEHSWGPELLQGSREALRVLQKVERVREPGEYIRVHVGKEQTRSAVCFRIHRRTCFLPTGENRSKDKISFSFLLRRSWTLECSGCATRYCSAGKVNSMIAHTAVPVPTLLRDSVWDRTGFFAKRVGKKGGNAERIQQNGNGKPWVKWAVINYSCKM